MKPYSPEDALNNKVTHIPDFVIEAFNNLLTKQYNGSSATLKQDDVIDEIERIHPMDTSRSYDPVAFRHTIFNNNWLDVESIFEKYGWKVQYKKPSYDENFTAHFTFSKGK